MVAMLFNVAAPLGFCWCEGCSCGNHISRFLPVSAVKEGAVTEEKCCCTPSEPPEETCCGLPETPCQCPCGDIQQDDATAPKGALLVEKPTVAPVRHIVSVLPADFADVSGTLSRLDKHRILLPSHVPLHVLLCVFLN